MQTYISILRGINVGGKKKIKMEELKAAYESLGFENIRTYIQTGNVIFDSSVPNESDINASIRNQLAAVFGFQISVLIRRMDGFQQIIKGNPFLDEQAVDPRALHVTFLSQAPSQTALAVIEPAADDGDQYRFSDSNEEVYLFCPDGYGRTRLSNSFFEKKLGVSATTRNWNTVNRLYEIAGTESSEY
ncbi:MAG: DUF1697 domain-containing protein [Thermoleophilia bacterium]|nr:DUF1697 domain-containing protein [Thermoleophilia bacterium]